MYLLAIALIAIGVSSLFGFADLFLRSGPYQSLTAILLILLGVALCYLRHKRSQRK